MIHPADSELLSALLKSEEIPADVEEEYSIRQRMYHATGGNGPLLIWALIDMLRFLGYKRPEDPKPVSVDWRQKVGAQIVAKYGDQDMPGMLTGLGDGGMLVCLLDGVETEVELPRYLVTLAEGEKKSRKGK